MLLSSCSWGYLGALQVWDNPLHPDIDGGVLLTAPEIHLLDVRHEIEYVSARFEAVTVKAGMQKPIKEETAAMKTTGIHREQERWKKAIGLTC